MDASPLTLRPLADPSRLDNRRARPDRRKCPYCLGWYFVSRKNQATCLKPGCEKANLRRLQREWKARRDFLKVAKSCLKCEKLFKPEGRFDRVCPKCEAENEKNY